MCVSEVEIGYDELKRIVNVHEIVLNEVVVSRTIRADNRCDERESRFMLSGLEVNVIQRGLRLHLVHLISLNFSEWIV